MNFMTFKDLEPYILSSQRVNDITVWLTNYTFCQQKERFIGNTWIPLEIEGYPVKKVEKSFKIWENIFHCISVQRVKSKIWSPWDYQVHEKYAYVVDSHGSFIEITTVWCQQKLIDIIWKLPIFWENFYIALTHTGQTYVLDSSLAVKKDRLGRDIRNVFKTVRCDWVDLVFCEVFEYGKGVTSTVLKSNFSPLVWSDGKEVICVKKYDFKDGSIELEVENEDGKIITLFLRKS